MSDHSELRKELRNMKRDLDRLSRRRPTELPTLGTQLQASLNIIDFATHRYYLNRTLYPRQATVLKLIFLGRDMQGQNILTDYDHEVIGKWTNRFKDTGCEGVQPDIYERMEMCAAEGRYWFREFVAVIGRRGSKNFLGGIAGAYILYHYINLGDPHAHYGIDRDKRLSAMIFAGKRDQAKARQWRDLINVIRGAECFAPYISRELAESMTLWSQHQQRPQSHTEVDRAAFEILAKESTALAGRGPANFMLVFDEFAHITPVEQANALYDSSVPSLDQFGLDSFIFMPSSPWQKLGRFHERYEMALETDDETGGPMYPEMLMLQLPSWALYEDWARTGIRGIPMLPSSSVKNEETGEEEYVTQYFEAEPVHLCR